MKLLHVVGARPNYMKAASVMRAAQEHGGFRQRLVHTGQHYDAAMNDVFFADLGLPQPDHHLGVGAGSHAEQTAKDELDCLGALEDSDLSDRDKCAEVVALLHGTKNISQITTTMQERLSDKAPADRTGAATGGY